MDDENLLVEKIVSCLFHLVGVHQWGQGKFVDLFNNLVGNRAFPEGFVQNVWICNYLGCDHCLILEEELLDPNCAEFIMLLEDVCFTTRLEQLSRCAHHISTSSLESYHSVAISYRKKRYHL